MTFLVICNILGNTKNKAEIILMRKSRFVYVGFYVLPETKNELEREAEKEDLPLSLFLRRNAKKFLPGVLAKSNNQTGNRSKGE